MNNFGEKDPKSMPDHLFYGATKIAYATAERADINKQNYTVCPRHWYITATFTCQGCGNPFLFTASEQQIWYEEYRFFVYSQPNKCLECRRLARHVKQLRQEYDVKIAEALAADDQELKKAVIAIVDALEEAGATLADGVQENRLLLLRQIANQE